MSLSVCVCVCVHVNHNSIPMRGRIKESHLVITYHPVIHLVITYHPVITQGKY